MRTYIPGGLQNASSSRTLTSASNVWVAQEHISRQHSEMESCQLTLCMLRLESNVSTRIFSPTKVGLETTDVSFLTLAQHQLLERGSRTLLDAQRGGSIVYLRDLYRHEVTSWIRYVVGTRCMNEFISYTLMWNTYPTRTSRSL